MAAWAGVAPTFRGSEPRVLLLNDHAVGRVAGLAPARPGWKPGMLAVEHQTRGCDVGGSCCPLHSAGARRCCGRWWTCWELNPGPASCKEGAQPAAQAHVGVIGGIRTRVSRLTTCGPSLLDDEHREAGSGGGSRTLLLWLMRPSGSLDRSPHRILSRASGGECMPRRAGARPCSPYWYAREELHLHALTGTSF